MSFTRLLLAAQSRAPALLRTMRSIPRPIKIVGGCSLAVAGVTPVTMAKESSVLDCGCPSAHHDIHASCHKNVGLRFIRLFFENARDHKGEVRLNQTLDYATTDCLLRKAGMSDQERKNFFQEVISVHHT
jgi:hypothetical protein